MERVASGHRIEPVGITAPTSLPPPKYEMTDGHLHFLNFVQGTSGMDALVKAMDDTGVNAPSPADDGFG